MAKSEAQKAKILYLKKIFEENTDPSHALTMPELIEQLKAYDIPAERKSIYRDIELLRDYGMDIVTRKEGNTTGYYLCGRDFEEMELKLLLDVVQSSRFITAKKSESLIKKLEGLTSRHEARSLRGQVHVANRIKSMNESIYYSVDAIQKALLVNRQISFVYCKYNLQLKKVPVHDGKIYKLSPWALTWDDENYYLIAYDSEADIIKHFRVDKMKSINVLEEKREGQEKFKNFDMALYSRKTFGMYGGEDKHVTLRCDADLVDAIADRFGTDILVRPVDCRKDAEQFDVTVKVAVSPVFLTWIMNFGGKIRILSPESVKQSLIDLAEAAVKAHGE